METVRKETIMSRMKLIFAMLVLVAAVSVAPMAQAQTLKVVIAGSSAMWQATGLGAYNNGTSIVSGANSTCHYTSGSNFNLVDNRTTPAATTDSGAAWIVWDFDPTQGHPCGDAAQVALNVWAYQKVDSVVGNRCYFAAPKCSVVTNGVFPGIGSQIHVWPDNSADVVPPASVQSLFTTGTFVTVAATDIRPEDAAFATCRVNSDGLVAGNSGASTVGGANSDGLDGLGYNTNNAPGVCPVYAAGTAQAKGKGTSIVSGYPSGPAAPVNVLAFNLTGRDPITNTLLPAAYTVTAVGAAPIVFINSRSGALSNLHNVTEQQLQKAFSGTNCNANAFGLPAGAINVFLREPLSGTYNTTEATVMRYPTSYPNPVVGLSMETGVTTNPLANTCAGGSGKRFRANGTGEEVKSVLNSNSAFGTDNRDGIGFTFFSYGNVSSVANLAGYGYVTLDGIDPIFASYGAGQTIDPGQPSGQGIIPAQANLPLAVCNHSFPCPESSIWGNGFSFPNLRNGTYRSWSVLRLVATGTPSTNALALAKASNKYVVINTPDYVPAATVTGTTDLGLKLLRSHYQQKDGNNTNVGAGPAGNLPEKGGDMGGMIVPTTAGVTTEKQTQIVQGSLIDGALSPSKRP
jgi:hypothetical protein